VPANVDPEESEPAADQLLDVVLIVAFLPLYLLGWLLKALWRLLVRRDL